MRKQKANFFFGGSGDGIELVSEGGLHIIPIPPFCQKLGQGRHMGRFSGHSLKGLPQGPVLCKAVLIYELLKVISQQHKNPVLGKHSCSPEILNE